MKKIITDLKIDLKKEKKKQVENTQKVEEGKKVLEDKHARFQGELKLSYRRNHELYESVKRLEVELEKEKKAKDEALGHVQKYCEQTVEAEIQWRPLSKGTLLSRRPMR